MVRVNAEYKLIKLTDHVINRLPSFAAQSQEARPERLCVQQRLHRSCILQHLRALLGSSCMTSSDLSTVWRVCRNHLWRCFLRRYTIVAKLDDPA